MRNRGDRIPISRGCWTSSEGRKSWPACRQVVVLLLCLVGASVALTRTFAGEPAANEESRGAEDPDALPVPGGSDGLPPPVDDEQFAPPISEDESGESPVQEERGSLRVPVFGKLSSRSLGMPVFTFLVGLVDGFNPCAMWVLLFLLSVLVNLRSRWRILAVAGTFVAISGAAYFAFMAAWLNVFLWIGYLRWVQARASAH